MKVFVSYSHRDEAVLERLHVHLATLRREGIVVDWHDRRILAGDQVEAVISKELDSCDLFLPLVSPDFLSSRYCYEKEMARAIERHDAGGLKLVPIIIQPCDWKNSPLSKFKALPKDGKPVSEWTNENAALLDVVTELRNLIQAGSSKEPPRSSTPLPRELARYRVKSVFDKVDKADFRDSAFRTIRGHFQRCIDELNSIEGLKSRYRDLGPTSFSCTVLNQKNGQTAHITFHVGAGLGDITYSYSENAASNTANGWFYVKADDHDLYLEASAFTKTDRDRRVSSEAAAEQVWEEFLEQAGITHG